MHILKTSHTGKEIIYSPPVFKYLFDCASFLDYPALMIIDVTWSYQNLVAR